MPRKKLTEYKAKQILFPYLDIKNTGFQVNQYNSQLNEVNDQESYVIKVDQGVKKRFKNGLIKVGVSKSEIMNFIEKLKSKGYQSFYIDRFVPHQSFNEVYISLQRQSDGIKVTFSEHGGIDIEDNTDSLQEYIIKKDSDIDSLNSKLRLPDKILENIIECFEDNYFSFLEINPLVVENQKIYILDLAVEVDSSAEFFVEKWSSSDFVQEKKDDYYEEVANIDKLKEKSTASFRLNILNKNGGIFMLLSGGGASIVLADELYNLGHADKLGNYGEYSGNPNTEETYIYTKNVLNLLLKSKAKDKSLIIAGGVANFTDIDKTFRGVIQALDKFKKELHNQKIKVFVRRGGPNQTVGLKNMKEFLQKNKLYGNVSGPDKPLTSVVHEALEYINK